MNADPNVDIFDEIQSLCREFRQRLKAGQSASIDQYLSRIDDSARDTLFQNLLHLEIEFQRRRGESPTSEEYIKRFPQYAGLIRQAFFESTMMSQELLGDTPDSDTPTVTLGLPAARKLGEYELLRELGRGGFGVVYEARHLQRGDHVALKTLPMSLDGQPESSRDAERLHRFRREFRSLSEINHPNLAGMQTLEVDGNQWFFTMDLIEGVDFLQYVRPSGNLDEPRLRASLKQLVRGIIALHEQGIVHRDLKPSNVLVGIDGHVTILDFGLVAELQHLAGETLSIGTKHFAGTPRYAAPEQASGKRSAAVDWYALAVMLYEAIIGDAPLKGSGVDLLVAKQTTDAPALSAREGVPKDLAELVDAMLRRDPGQRPRDQEVADAVGVQPESTVHDSTATSSSLLEDSAGQSGHFLVGRERQLAELDERLRQFASSGQPEAVFISGRSGEGKTSLVESFLSGVRRDGKMLVLGGRCYDRESVPFKAIDCLIDPLVAHLRARSDDELNQLLPDDIGMLAQLFPVLRRVESIADRASTISASIDSRQIRYRAFAALRELLTNISRHRPLILFIDDLQWGDADSAAALHEVLRPPDSPAVLLLGSYRSDEADSSQFLTEWGEEQSEDSNSIEQREIGVAPLTEEQCVLLVASRLGISPETLREQSGELFEDTRGNPYFVEQLIEGFDPESNQFHAIPLDELIARKLDRLPPAAKSLLQAVAIAGQSSSMEEVAAVAGESEQAFATLTHMRSERLVRLVGSDESQLVDTNHDKIRETVVNGLADVERRKLHVRYGELLESAADVSADAMLQQLARDLTWDELEIPQTDRIFDLAYHFQAAKDPRGFAYQFMAGELSFQAYASDDAMDAFERAAATSPANCQQEMRFRLHQRLARTSARLGEFASALEHYEKASDAAASSLQHANINEGIATAYRIRSEYRSALNYYDLALSQLGLPRPKRFAAVFRFFLEALQLAARPPKWRTDVEIEPEQAAKYALTQQIFFGLLAFIWELPDGMIGYPYILLRTSNLNRFVRSDGSWCVGLTYPGAQIALNGFPWVGKWLLSKAEPVARQINDEESKGLFALGTAMTNHYSGDSRTADLQYSDGFQRLTKCGNHSFINICAHMHRHLHAVIAPSCRELESASRVLYWAEIASDRRGQCWGHYDTASALARAGNITTALMSIESARKNLQPAERNITDAIFLGTEGYVRIQASAYHAARYSLEAAWYLVKRRKILMDVTVRALPYLIESLVGPEWVQSTDPQTEKRLRSLARVAVAMDWLYPNIASPAQRARGRAYASMGKLRKSHRCFSKAIRSARDFGAEYDCAKSLLDLAAVKEDGRREMRAEAIELLKKMESVIPYAERWLLGDQYDPEVVAPPPIQHFMEDESS